MQKKAKPALPVAVKQLRRRIDEWRTIRERRTRMPPELWAEAVALARSEGAYPVARALGVNFEALKRRVAEASASPTAAASPTSEFVEMARMHVMAASPSSTGAVVELEDGARRLVVRLPAEAALDVARVVAAFVGRGA
jgi:transposase-like protein